jgi:aryl-alcohol dehydrogenase-like predicted oxidoreductase/predicted kinase
MRLPTDGEELALDTIAAAAEAGLTVFDTARAYGENEALLARGLGRTGIAGTARIVTKGGMSRPEGAWVPDGRAKTIRADCEASLEALDGLPIDLYLVHAPDPRTPWRTTVRALARLLDEGLVHHVGVSNVNAAQLEEALTLAPLTAVEIALSPFDDRALRGGIVERCAKAGIAVIAHSPLGGPRRAPRLDRVPALATIAEARGVAAAQVALAWLLDLSPCVVPIPGARRPETARSAAGAATLELERDERATLSTALGGLRRASGRRARRPGSAEVVLVMGVPGAGKSRVAGELVRNGYTRLNRDERGGSLRELAAALDEELAAGSSHVVLDNTYLTRAARSHVVEAAHRRGASVRCVWLDTPLAQAQVNLVERLLASFGSLPSPEELREAARGEPGLLTPTRQMRAFRELEPPSREEGLDAVEQVPFARTPSSGRRRGVFVAAGAVAQPGWEQALGEARDAPVLVFDWSPDGSTTRLDDAARLLAARSRTVEAALCPHPGGPPTCWCRPPLPGLVLAFARVHDVDPSRSLLVGSGTAHRTLATALGARYVEP